MDRHHQGSSGGLASAPPTFTIAKNPNKPPSPSPPSAAASTAAQLHPSQQQHVAAYHQQHQAGAGPALLPTPTSLLPPPQPAAVAAAFQQLPPLEDSATIDPFLLQALNQPKDRLTILKLDHELEKFINNSRRLRLDLPPMSSYQRLIVHRVAHHFRLHHVVVDPDGLGQKRAIILFKTPESRVPIIRFLDLLEEEQEPPPQKVKIMRRQTKSPSPQGERANPEESSTATNNNSTDDAVPRLLKREPVPIEEREEAYLRARARIFNEEAAAAKSQLDGSKTASADNSNVNEKEASSIQRPSSAGSGLERGTEAEEREWEEREAARKKEKAERELERWRQQQQQQQYQRAPQHAGVVSPVPSSAHQFWAYGDAADEADGTRLLEDSEDLADTMNNAITGNHAGVYNASGGADGRGGRRLGGSGGGGGGGKKPGRNRSPSPVKSGGGGYISSEGLVQPYPGAMFVPSGRGRGGMDHGMVQPPFVPGFLRGPPVLQGAPYALADSNAFPPLSSYGGPSQGNSAGGYYPTYLPPPHHPHQQQQQQHYNYQQQQQQPQQHKGYSNEQPVLADFPSMPYALPPHIPLMSGTHGPYHGQSPSASHLPLAMPPMGGVPTPKGYPYYPRGEYDRPPPKSTELFDPKAPTSSSSSSSSTPSASSAPYYPGPPSMPTSAAAPSFGAAPSARSYSASRAAAGGPHSTYPHVHQQPQQQQQRYQQQQAAPTSAYGNDDGLSGPMGNMRIATGSAQQQQQQQQQVWGDHGPLIYSPNSQQAYHHHHNARGGYGNVRGRGGAVSGFGAAGPAAFSSVGAADVGPTAGPKPTPLDGGSNGKLQMEGNESNAASSSARSESSGAGGNESAGEQVPPPQQQQQQQPSVVSFSHILEVAGLPDEVRSNSAEAAHIVDTLKKAGATNVKFLGSSSVIAIFKNGGAAKKALETVESSQFKLRPWIAPLSPGGPPAAAAQGAGAMSSPTPPASAHPPATSPSPPPPSSSSSS